MWRCANDIFGYCSGEPKWSKPALEFSVGNYLRGGSCKRNLGTCGEYESFSGLVSGRGLPSSKYRKTKQGRIVKIKDDKATHYKKP